MALRAPGKLRAGQLYQGKSWTGITKESHIDQAFGRDGQNYITDTIKHLIDINMEYSFVKWYNQFPVREVATNEPFKWKLKGYHDKTCYLRGAWSDEAGSTAITTVARPGYNGTFIYLDFNEKRFSNTAIIVGENPDWYKFHIQGDPVQVGTSVWRYRTRLFTNDPTEYVPQAELVVGSRWSVEGGAVSRYGSIDGQDISFATSFAMEERIKEIRMKHNVYGEMVDIDKNKPLLFKLESSDGQEHRYWMNLVEWEFFKQAELRKAYNVFYGKGTVDDDGKTLMTDERGMEIVHGRGIREQFLPSNKHYYNTISLDYLTRVATDTTFGKIAPENRRMVIGTGEYGLVELHKMIQREFGNGGVIQNYNWLGDTTGRAFNWTGGVNNNDMTARFGQFRGVAVINGIYFEFVHFPHYDDLIRNKKRHPKGGYAESHRFTIMDFGNRTEPNIVRVRIKGRKAQYGYEPGLRTPWDVDGTMGRPKMITSGFDGFTMHHMDWEGAAVLDPTRVIEFIPNVLAPKTTYVS